MTEWLRPVFSRAKTPVQGATATFERQTSASIDESLPDIEEVLTPRLRPGSRVSSYIGFSNRPSTPPVPNVPEAFQNARNPEFLYQKPSGDQMAETLKVVMMTKCLMDPVPIEYNACILHVLEAYQDLREQVDTKSKLIEQVTKDHARDIRTFEELATKWDLKERDYKAELKKLEVLLSKTEGGMESVVMARSNSRIHGSTRASDEIGRHFSTIKDRHRQRSFQSEVDQRAETETLGPMAQLSNAANIHSSGISRTQLEALERQQIGFKRGLASYESSSGVGTSTDSMSQDLTSQEDGLGLGIITEEKPLPEIPTERSALRRTKTKSSSKPIQLGPPATEEMSFSFQPGDDNNVLTHGDDVTNAHRIVFKDLQRRFTAPGERPETPPSTTPARRSPDRSTDSPSANKLRPDSRKSVAYSGSASPNLQSSDQVSRGGSTASVVTAIRDNSGRSSACGSRAESRNGRPHLDRNQSTSEAVTAAARAYVASNQRSSEGKSRTGTTTPDERGVVEESLKGNAVGDRKSKGPMISIVREIDRS